MDNHRASVSRILYIRRNKYTENRNSCIKQLKNIYIDDKLMQYELSHCVGFTPVADGVGITLLQLQRSTMGGLFS